jgi:hypothetical protein
LISHEHTLIIDDLRLKTRPAFLQYGKGDFAEAVSTVDNLLKELLESEVSIENREVQGCYLEFLRINLMLARDTSWDCAQVQNLISQWSTPLVTRYGNHERVSFLLQLKAHAGAECGCPMDEPEYRGLMADKQLLQRSPSLWDAIGIWAFRNSYVDVLDEAFENQTIHPSESMPQESWQRINLMLQLRRGTANRRDVQEYILLLRIVPQIMEFRDVLLPVIEEQGLWDEELAQAVELKMETAMSGAYKFPRERRTGRMRS